MCLIIPKNKVKMNQSFAKFGQNSIDFSRFFSGMSNGKLISFSLQSILYALSPDFLGINPILQNLPT